MDIEIFKISNKLNISDEYEAFPKEVSPRDQSIQWSDNGRIIINSHRRIFHLNNVPFEMVITPAQITNRKDKRTNISRYPYMIEAKVEYAILSLASRKVEVKKHDPTAGDKPILFITTSVYEIKKEIARSINKFRAEELQERLKELAREGKTMSEAEKKKYKPIQPNNTYNNYQIIDAIKVLKRTNYEVQELGGQSHWEFNRIKDFGYTEDGKKIIIELGTEIAKYINSNLWRPVEGHNFLASHSYYELRIRDLLYNRFTYANKNNTYDPGFQLLLEYTNHPFVRSMKETAMKLVKIMEDMKEIKSVKLDYFKEGRKIVNIVFHIKASDYFISSQISSNLLLKERDKAVYYKDELLMQPVRSSYDNDNDYNRALADYGRKMKEYSLEIAKGVRHAGKTVKELKEIEVKD